MNVYSLIRDQPWYRREAFERGLLSCGHNVKRGYPPDINKDTALLIWNRYAENHTLALKVEDAGGKVLVAENGYLGRHGTSPKFDVHPHGPSQESYYAISRGYHNDDSDACIPYVRGADRWRRLEVNLKPWKEDSSNTILVAPNRSFGVSGRMQPAGWGLTVADIIARRSGAKVIRREHPGAAEPKRALSLDLALSDRVVIWSSTVGVHALCEGIPVTCCAPFWICKSASESYGSGVRAACVTEEQRLAAMIRMSWAQWTVEEITRGDPFEYLL